MRNYLIVFGILFFAAYAAAQTKNTKKEALLVGIFHFNNPGADLAKTETFNVMSKKSQQELESALIFSAN